MENISNDGVNKLAGVLQKRTKVLSDKPSVIDVGEIQEDMSLLCNKFPLPIPQSDYMVCRSVVLGKVDDILYRTQEVRKDNSGLHYHDLKVNGNHSHTTSTPCSGCNPTQNLSGTTESGGEEEVHSHDFSISCSGCVTNKNLSGTTNETGDHTHTEDGRNMEHVHDMLIGEKMRQLQPKDRVLVVWIDSADPCVVDLIYPATYLERDGNNYYIEME